MSASMLNNGAMTPAAPSRMGPAGGKRKKVGLITNREVEEEDADGMECCAQWSLLLTNAPVLLIGVALVALGAYTLSERSYLDALQPDGASMYAAVSGVMVATGCVLVVLAVFGCVAAFRENKCALMVYYAVVVVVFLLLCIVAVVGYVYRTSVAENLRQDLVDSVREYDPERKSAPATEAWDRLQSELKCCGVAVTDDPAAGAAPPYTVWRNNLRLNSGQAEARVPTSCCLSDSTDSGLLADCTSDPVADSALIYTNDCFDSGANYLQDHVRTLGICCIVFAVALVVAAALSICLYHLADE